MDAHFFRRLCGELACVLAGARVEKVYRPAPEVTNFVLYAAGRKQNLLLRAGRRFPLLFLSDKRPDNPFQPDGKTMWLRKHLCKRRLGLPQVDWVGRRIAFPLTYRRIPEGWFLLDLRDGASVIKTLPEDFSTPPQWPDPAEFQSVLETREAWASYPQFSPPLRKSLAVMDPLDAQALLIDLEEPLLPELPALFTESATFESTVCEPTASQADDIESQSDTDTSSSGETDISEGSSALSTVATEDESPQFQSDNDGLRLPTREEVADAMADLPEVFLYLKDGTAAQALVWPLPPEVRGNMEEHAVATAMEAANRLGEAVLFSELARAEAVEAAAPVQAAIKKTKRTLNKLVKEHDRLSNMVSGQEAAKLIQADLWRIGGEQKLAEVTVQVPSDDGSVEEQVIPLDPKLTVRENMARLFKQATRGKRGLDMLDVRRDVIEQDLSRLQSGETKPEPRQQRVSPVVEKRLKKMAARDKFIHRFRSSDGFIMLRGRSAEGNHEVLTRASAHDLWFHAEDGPSAHLVLRLDYPEQEVPERTLEEAAILVGLKSWERDAGQARVMCALVKEVRKIKGAAHGKVRVSQVLQSLLVELDESLEEGLRSAL